MSIRLVVALSGTLLSLLAGCGEDPGAEVAAKAATGGEVEIHDAWVRATKGTDDPSMTGAFMAIENSSGAQVTLTGASSDVAGMAEIHQMVMEDGEMVMQRIEGGLEVPAGQTTVLMPGGNHVMLMGLKSGLVPGDEVMLTLEFADGTTEQLTLPVKKFTEEEPHYHDKSEDAHE